MITRNHRQESLCRAYTQAIAAAAGAVTSIPIPDYGVNQCLREVLQRGERRLDSRLQLDLQLRSTTRANLAATHIGYDLDVQSHEFLREITPVPCLLVVLVLPEDENEWLFQSEEEFAIRNCAYWLSLRGQPRSSARSSIRVALPRTQAFTPAAVCAIFQRLRRGEEP